MTSGAQQVAAQQYSSSAGGGSVAAAAGPEVCAPATPAALAAVSERLAAIR